MKPLLSGLILLAALAAFPGAALAQAAAPVTVGDPRQPDTLAALQAAYAHGSRKIVIRPGTYFLPNVGHTAIKLDGWKDTVISGYGVTLILTDLQWTHDGIDLKNCAGSLSLA